MEPVYLLIILLSIIISIFSIIAGLGGGVLLVPLLSIGFGFPLKIVIGTVMVSLIVPASIGSFGAFRRKEIFVKFGLLFEIPTAIGVYFGAKLTVALSEEIIYVVFGSVALILSINMVIKALSTKNHKENKNSIWTHIGSIKPVITIKKGEENHRISIPSLIIAGLIIGFLAGMLGVGGGWLKTPLMVLAFGIGANIATGTAIFMILMTSITGGATHYSIGNIDTALLGSLVIGLGIGAIIGNYLKPKFKNYQITFVVAFILLIVAITMIYSAIIAIL